LTTSNQSPPQAGSSDGKRTSCNGPESVFHTTACCGRTCTAKLADRKTCHFPFDASGVPTDTYRPQTLSCKHVMTFVEVLDGLRDSASTAIVLPFWQVWLGVESL
jgi:hypothetical protein